MEFNINWTKEDNNQLRNFIKKGKSPDYIREYFGNDKLFYNPSKKYHISGKSSAIPTFRDDIKDFEGFINEIKYEPLKTDFQVDFSKSKKFINKFDYIYSFQTNSGNRYVIDLIYLFDKIGPYRESDIYNISFSLEKNRDTSNYIEYEKQTMLNEGHEIVKRIIFILKDFNQKFGNDCIYLIGETEDKRKLNWYRNLIKDSFENVKETVGVSSFTNGLSAYYYELKK